MQGNLARRWLLAVAVQGLLFAAAAQAEVLNSGAWRVITQDKAPKYEFNTCTWEGWTGAERKGGKSIIRWFPADYDKDRGKPVKFILMFGDPDESGSWYTSETHVEDWFNCVGQGQWDFMVETAADVGELVDLNPDGHYRIWVAVEYENKSRLPFDGRGFITVTEYNEETRKSLSPCAVKLAPDYKWDAKNSSHPGNKPDVNGKVDPNGFNVVHKSKAAPFGGVVVPNYEWNSARKPKEKSVIRFPAPLDDKVGGKAVKFLLFFGSDTAEWVAEQASVQAWYECRGEGQWDWFLEVGSAVRQVYDPNEGKYRVWMAVEYESGRRLPFFHDNFPVTETSTDPASLDTNCVKLPEGYKWPGEGEETVNIKEQMSAWTKVGRTWTMRTVSKAKGVDTISFAKFEITAVTDTECVYTLTMMDKDRKEVSTAKDQKVTFLVPKTEPLNTADETIDVPAGKFDCLKSETTNTTVKTTVWTSKKLPGLTVKLISNSAGVEAITELVELTE